MADISFESIRPNLVSAVADGATLRCVFACPVSGQRIEAHASLTRGQRLGEAAAASAKQSLLWSIRNAIVQGLRSVLGYGVIGSLGADVANSAMAGVGHGGATTPTEFSDEERQAAALRAFHSVETRFTWDERSRRFVAAETAAEGESDFQRQLRTSPPTTRFDRGVMARMLLDVAGADGRVSDEESALLAQFIAPDLGPVNELARRPPLSRAELQETSPPTRETSLMIAWAVALADSDLDDSERAQLAAHTAGLGIPEERASELRRMAQLFVVDQALSRAYGTSAGQARPGVADEVRELARRIGLSGEEAERAEVRYRKRHGLI